MNERNQSGEKMKRFRNLLIRSLAVVGFLLVVTAAKADTLTLTLNPAYQSGSSTSWVFTGTISYTSSDALNDSGATEFLNGDASYVDAPSVLDDSSFNINAPLSMIPGQSYTGVMFTVTTPSYSSGLSNDYVGYFDIVGGNSPSDDTDVLASSNFNIHVTPEPPGWELMALALAGSFAAISWKFWRGHTNG
jgi:hypothetical protein